MSTPHDWTSAPNPEGGYDPFVARLVAAILIGAVIMQMIFTGQPWWRIGFACFIWLAVQLVLAKR